MNWVDPLGLGKKQPDEDKSGDFFEGTTYTDKVKKQMQPDKNQETDFHGFPESVKAFQKEGKVTTMTDQADGVIRQKLEIPGGYKKREGVFEFIKEPDGKINHRFFNPKINK